MGSIDWQTMLRILGDSMKPDFTGEQRSPGVSTSIRSFPEGKQVCSSLPLTRKACLSDSVEFSYISGCEPLVADLILMPSAVLALISIIKNLTPSHTIGQSCHQFID